MTWEIQKYQLMQSFNRCLIGMQVYIKTEKYKDGTYSPYKPPITSGSTRQLIHQPKGHYYIFTFLHNQHFFLNQVVSFQC